MSTAATSYPNYSPASAGLLSGNEMTIDCACNEESNQKGNFFRGILVAVPAGMAMWVGLLKLATVIAHHI